MWISRYVCVFIIYGFLGWVYESLLCTVRSGKWTNRGFLFGSNCPIYGVGTVAIMAIVNSAEGSGTELSAVHIFIISVIGSAILEFVTSWVLEKLFHARWWDYSRLPFNLQGRISLFTSLGFGLAGLFVVYISVPETDALMAGVTPLWTEVLALIAVAVFMSDLTLTVTVLMHFDRTVIRLTDSFNKNMTSLVDGTVKRTTELRRDMEERQNLINERLSSMHIAVTSAAGRIQSFRYKNESTKTAAERFMEMLRSRR